MDYNQTMCSYWHYSGACDFFFSRILIAFQLYTVLLLIYLLFSLIKAVLKKPGLVRYN